MAMSYLDQRKYLADLIVDGFLRIHCSKHYNYPMDIQQLCLFMYFEVTDAWNIKISDETILIDTKNNIAYNAGATTYSFWLDVVGTMIAKKGSMINKFIWKLKLLKNKQHSLFFGIIDRNTYYQHKGYLFVFRDNGYGICTTNGKIYSKTALRTKNGYKYLHTKCKCNDVIEMRLDMDMRHDQHPKYATLSYLINDKDYGIAFDKININKEYLMIVALYNGDQVQLVP